MPHLTTCKASWTITKIIWWDYTINKCGLYYRFRLNDWIRDYVIRWIEKNTGWYWTWCENWFYAFSWWDLPKIWDEMYVIAQYSDSWLIEQWKEIFSKYEKLPNCPITADWDPSYENYLWADKCKVSWKIENIKKIFTDKCWFNLTLELHNNKDIYFIGGREYFYSQKYGAYCLGVWQGWFPVIKYWTKWEILISYSPNIGDTFYAVLNQKDNTVLRYGENEYNTDTTIPVCKTETHPENYSMTGGISKEKETLVMQAVGKEFYKREFPKNNTNSSVVWIENSISTWTTTTEKENLPVYKKSNIIPPKKIYLPKQEIVRTSSRNIIEAWNKTDDNSNQTSTWVNEGKDAWNIIQNQIVDNKIPLNGQEVEKSIVISPINNHYYTYWIMLILLWIILTLIFKKIRKTK